MESAIIEKEALKLPPHERALLADRLLRTLTPHEDSSTRAWAAEVERRLAAFHNGTQEALDGKTVIESLRKNRITNQLKTF